MSEPPADSNQPRNPEVRHEPSDVSVRGVLWFAGGLAATTLIILVLLDWMFDALAERRKAQQPPPAFVSGRPERPVLPPEPRLEGIQTPSTKTAGHASAVLNSYGWVDENAGIVHIPIEKAMERILAEKKLKSRKDSPRMPKDLIGPFRGGDGSR